MKDHLTSALAQLNGSADWNRRTGGTLPAKLTCFEAQDVLTALQELQQRAEQAEREVERLTARESNQSERIRYLEGATNHATGTPLTHMKARAERAESQLHALRLVCGTTDADKFATWVDRANAKAEKAEAELAKAKAVLASIEEDGTEEHNAAVRLRQELATERARLRQLALDACRAAAIVPLVWYPEGYYVNPNDLGKINKQQVDACVAAIDAAMKEESA